MLALPHARRAAEPLPVTLTSSKRATGPVIGGQVGQQITLIRSLFRGRDDVYAVRWTSKTTGRSGYSPAVQGGWAAARDEPKVYLPLTDEVVAEHLLGTKTVGIYPLLIDDTCWFLACDFDGNGWTLDALALLEACDQHGIPASLERSRSGAGGHVWLFFSSPVSAVAARRLGTGLLREAMTARAEIDLGSYDRFFPNQDFLPKGSLGNLIALPLQGGSREAGNAVFLDPSTLEPWPDQRDALSHVGRASPEKVEQVLESMSPVTAGSDTAKATLRRSTALAPAPPIVHCTRHARLTVPKSGLPPWLLAEIKHLASLHNPQFYERERLRLSTFQTPRFIKCYEEDLSHIHLPRGVLDGLKELVNRAGSELAATEGRTLPEKLDLTFRGTLTPLQQEAVGNLLAHDLGVLVAPPGTGKTVMGCAVIAARSLPTLVLVHRKPLLDQWRVQLIGLLNLSPEQVGQVGGGKKKLMGVVDLAMIQSLKGRDDLERFFEAYGLVIIDECHHVPAFSFESAVKRAPNRHFLGLTATPYRRDGLHEIITMQCGPILHRISPRQAEGQTELSLELRIRDTSFTFETNDDTAIQEVFSALALDAERNRFVCQDVLRALGNGRRCLILSQRKDHCKVLAESLAAAGKTPFTLDGGLRKRAREAAFELLRLRRSS
jgi:hypothetical protein